MGRQDDVVTWDDAEQALLDAVEYLAAMPDPERSMLAAGSRSAWPQILRIEQSDYPDRPKPGRRLSRTEIAHLDRMLLNPRACFSVIPEGQRALVGRVIAMKLWPGPDGFRWSRIWEREGGRATGVTSDALRRRYDRAVGKVAAAMEVIHA